MSVVAVAAGKGSPGVTTAAVALAAVWPRRCVLAECDPAGGDVVFRLRATGGGRIVADRGLVSLATAARAGVTAQLVGEHAQVTEGGLPVLVGTASESHTAALAGGWAGVSAAFAASDCDVVVDLGRLSSATPTHLLRAADVVVVVCRATAASVGHARHALDRLRREVEPRMLVVGHGDDTVQVRDALRGHGELDVLGPLADDAAGAAGLSGQWTRRLDRTSLVASARLVARSLDARLAERRAASVLSMPAVEAAVTVAGGHVG